jgi:YVTN family beta-propeller protein
MVISAVALAVRVLGQAAPAGAGTLVVLNKSDATASLIDVDTGKVVATLPTGRAPHEAAASPDGRLVLVSNYGTSDAPGSSLTVLEVAKARVQKTIDLGEHRRPHGLAWLDGRRALVTAEASKALLIVDVEAGKVEAAVTTGQDVSHMVAKTPDGSRAFVANIGSGSITVVDVPGRKAVENVATGKGAEGIDVTPDGKRVWVTNREADTVSVVDAASLKVLATLEAKSFPIRARVTPDGRHVLVSCARTGEVAVFDASSFKEERRIALKLEAGSTKGRLMDFGASSVPIGIVVAPDGKRAFVAHANADVISVLDLEAWKPAGSLKAGQEPDGMAYSALAAKP